MLYSTGPNTNIGEGSWFLCWELFFGPVSGANLHLSFHAAASPYVPNPNDMDRMRVRQYGHNIIRKQSSMRARVYMAGDHPMYNQIVPPRRRNCTHQTITNALADVHPSYRLVIAGDGSSYHG